MDILVTASFKNHLTVHACRYSSKEPTKFVPLYADLFTGIEVCTLQPTQQHKPVIRTVPRDDVCITTAIHQGEIEPSAQMQLRQMGLA